MKKIILLISLIITNSIYVSSQVAEDVPIVKRADDVLRILNDPKDLDKVFSKEFLAQVPAEQVVQITTQFKANYGKPQKIQSINRKDDFNGVITILYDKGYLIKLNLVTVNKSPFLISGLLVSSVEKVTKSLETIVDDLKKLPGETSLTISKLENKSFNSIISYNSDQPFAIGSTFKFYVLGDLIRQITEGKKNWSDVVELKHFSLPSGQLQNFPKNSPMTLHTLASFMISISDNTATDQLMLTLGREKIEEMLTVTGNSNPNLTKPFLTTAEMFLLKGLEDQKYAKEYISADEKGKRKILSEKISKSNVSDIQLDIFLKKPTYISEIEWFASGNDLVRLMNWMRLNTEKEPANKARGIMSINKALNKDVADKWKYVGYKGGSEPGVISMTFLLQANSDEWFVVTGSWNNEKESLKDNDFIILMQTAVKVLQEQIEKK